MKSKPQILKKSKKNRTVECNSITIKVSQNCSFVQLQHIGNFLESQTTSICVHIYQCTMRPMITKIFLALSSAMP